MIFHTDSWLTIHGGDCREVLPTLEAESVHCVVTSPPYWGLRDYGTATWIGGDAGCDHKQNNYDRGVLIDASGRTDGGGASIATADKRRTPYLHTCGKCGAVRQDSQLGLEPTPEQYVANLVAVFREVRRVLRKDGTLWLNLGDSYAAQGGGKEAGLYVDKRTAAATWQSARRPTNGLKPKDLVGIPWRVAFALQADGWYLRSDIIWAKPNPMPESVTDRPTKSHEYLFLLSKSARYYYDADAVREPHEASTLARDKYGRNPVPPRSWNPENYPGLTKEATVTLVNNPAGRNLRSVWTIPTTPYPGAHFAVFPQKLVEPCIKAGTSERGVCPECGEPWRRSTEITRTFESGSGRAGHLPEGKNGADLQGGGETLDVRRGPTIHTRTLGWIPSCSHPTCRWCEDSPGAHDHVNVIREPVPATVLDPFAGSGTVGLVAQAHSRRAVLIDLNPDYLKQQLERNAQTPLGLGA